MPSVVWAEKRVALVVGNSDYQAVTRLRNPTNDARAIARTFRELGFEVLYRENLDGSGFRRALADFSARADGAEFAVFYFAGHGLQVRGRNFLVPVEADWQTETRAELEGISLSSVRAIVREAGRIGIVMVDACRDNPLSRTMRRADTTRAVRRGFVEEEDTAVVPRASRRSGLIVSFATGFGEVAADGQGRHSPYTQALLDVLPTAGLRVDDMFKLVRERVEETTDRQQRPIAQDALPSGNIYLVPPKTPSPGGGGAAGGERVETDPEVAYLEAVRREDWASIERFVNRYPNHPRAADARRVLSTVSDRKFWDLAKDADTLSAYSTYLAAFPEGLFAGQARERIKRLGNQSTEKKSTFTLFNSVDFFGGDLTEGGIKGITQAQCQSLCASNDACVAYSFVNDERQWCWPKSAIGERRSKLGLVSAIKIVTGGDVDLSTSPTPQGAAQSFQILQGQDIPGSDLLGQDRKGYSLRQCQLYCQSDPNCTAFSYVPRLSWCWPKSGVTVLQSDPGVISGVDTSVHDLARLGTRPTARFARQANMDFMGRDLAPQGHKGVTLEQCERICADDRRCQAYTYVHGNRSCWPKYAISATRRARGLTSGIKQ